MKTENFLSATTLLQRYMQLQQLLGQLGAELMEYRAGGVPPAGKRFSVTLRLFDSTSDISVDGIMFQQLLEHELHFTETVLKEIGITIDK